MSRPLPSDMIEAELRAIRPLGQYVLTEEDDRGVLLVGAVILILLALMFGAGLVVGSLWL